MKGLTFLLILLVLFIHFGGSKVPNILKKNKQIIYGIIIGLVLCSIFGGKIEGITPGSSVDYVEPGELTCNPSIGENIKNYIDTNKINRLNPGKPLNDESNKLFAENVCGQINNGLMKISSPSPNDICSFLGQNINFGSIMDIRNMKKCGKPQYNNCKEHTCDKLGYPSSSSDCEDFCRNAYLNDSETDTPQINN